MNKFNIIFLNVKEHKIKIKKNDFDRLYKSINSYGQLNKREDRKDQKYVYFYKSDWYCLDEIEIEN